MFFQLKNNLPYPDPSGNKADLDPKKQRKKWKVVANILLIFLVDVNFCEQSFL